MVGGRLVDYGTSVKQLRDSCASFPCMPACQSFLRVTTHTITTSYNVLTTSSMDLQFDIPPPAGLRIQTYYGQDFFGTQLCAKSGAGNTLPNATFKLSSTSTTLIACVGEEGAGVGKEMAYILGTPLDGQQFLTPTPLKVRGVKMGCQGERASAVVAAQ